LSCGEVSANLTRLIGIRIRLEVEKMRSTTPSNSIRTESIVTAALRHYVVVLFLLCSLPGIALGGQQEPNYALFTGSYSSFTHGEEGDLNGVEIHILFTGKGLKATVQFAEGGPGDVALVNVTATGTHLHFEMPAGFDPEGTFDGTVSARGLDGTFTRKGGYRQHVALPRTVGYWDKPNSK
jgi:hypothetical protein